MGTSVAIQLNDQPEVRELLQVLKGNGLEKEYKEVEALVSYLDSMESRFGQILNELQEIKNQLPLVQNNSVKDKVAEIVHTSENTVQETKNKLREAKESIVGHIKNALKSFKELGVKALQKAVTALKIPELLQGFEQTFQNRKESAEHSADKIASIRNEIHAIGVHTKNLGGMLAGKELQQTKEAPIPDKGILFRIEKAYRAVAKAFSVMEQATANVRNRLEQFLASGKEKKPSVRAELNHLKGENEKAAAEKTIPDKNMEAPTQDKHKQDVTR